MNSKITAIIPSVLTGVLGHAESYIGEVQYGA